MEGVKHSVEVTASTLYEAVALGLVEIRGQGWTAEIPGGFLSLPVCRELTRVACFAGATDFR
jgi:hypothetical protein